MKDKVRTPRGEFQITRLSMEELDFEGYGIWFRHNDYLIMSDGKRAVAIHQ